MILESQLGASSVNLLLELARKRLSNNGSLCAQ